MDPFAAAGIMLQAAGRDASKEAQEVEKAAAPTPEKTPQLPVAGPDVGEAAAGLLSLLVERPEDAEEGLGDVATKDERPMSPAEWDQHKGPSLAGDVSGSPKSRKGRPASPVQACCLKCKMNHRTVHHCRVVQGHTAANWCEPQAKKSKLSPTAPKSAAPAKQVKVPAAKRPTPVEVSEAVLPDPLLDSGRSSLESGQRRSAKRAREAVYEQVRAEESVTSPSSKKSPGLKLGENFSCPHCARLFPSHAAMSGHKRYCKEDAPLQVKSPVSKESVSDMSDFECPNCQRIFPTHAAMSGHKRYCKPGKPMVPGQSPKGASEVAALGNGNTTDTKTRHDGKASTPKAILG